MKDTGISRRAFLFGKAFAEDEEGATAIEYAIIATFIAVAMSGCARLLGTRMNYQFYWVRAMFDNSTRPPRKKK